MKNTSEPIDTVSASTIADVIAKVSRLRTAFAGKRRTDPVWVDGELESVRRDLSDLFAALGDVEIVTGAKAACLPNGTRLLHVPSDHLTDGAINHYTVADPGDDLHPRERYIVTRRAAR